MLGVVRQMRARGIVGINRRADYTLGWNPRRLYPLVDDKLYSKRLAIDADIAVPELIGAIEVERHARDFERFLQGREAFVIKPAHGSGGDGILVVTGRVNERYRKANGTVMEPWRVTRHVSNILSGMFSLGGQSDVAMIEALVEPDPLFAAITYEGVPDIRVIVYRGIPVMAMVRLPTRMSDGKANLHQGAIGVGIDMGTGVTHHGVCQEMSIDEHPDTGEKVGGLAIPEWDSLLRRAARCQEITGLGYMGVDIVLDREHGPLVLELNARPGLSIQIANRAGLNTRLAVVTQLDEPTQWDVDERVAFAREHFALTANAP